MSGNQQNLSNIAAGLQNLRAAPNVGGNIPATGTPVPPVQTSAPSQVPQMQHVPQQMARAPQMQHVPQQMAQAPNLAPNALVPQDGGDTMTIFGQSLPKKYVYIVGGLLLLAVVYYLYKYFNKGEDEEEDIDTEDDELNYMGPSEEMYQEQPNPEQLQKLQQMQQMARIQQMQKMQQMQQQMEMMAKMKASQEKQTEDPVDQGIDEVDV